MFYLTMLEFFFADWKMCKEFKGLFLNIPSNEKNMP